MPEAKKTAKRTTPAKRTAKKAVPRDRLPKASAKPEPRVFEPGEKVTDVEVPLSHAGQHTGAHKTLQLLAPAQDQMVYAESAFYRVNLAMRAANEGEAFDQEERGRIYSEIRRLAAVFLSTWQIDWVEDALASGAVQLADMWEAVAHAFEAVGGVPLNPDAETDGADITVGA
jgi:hypothetical protein